jgi:hypothetical protein
MNAEELVVPNDAARGCPVFAFSDFASILARDLWFGDQIFLESNIREVFARVAFVLALF